MPEEEMRKIYVTPYEFKRVQDALDTLEIFEDHEEMVANINYELPSNINLEDLRKGLQLILNMSEVVNSED